MDDKTMKNLNELAKQIKNVENGVNDMVVPLLKDSIKDTNIHNHRLFVLCIILIFSMLVVGIYSQFLVADQNKKYTEFLEQFEYESSDSTYIQDLDTTNGGNAIINSGIRVNE